jgi:hypothetical protein
MIAGAARDLLRWTGSLQCRSGWNFTQGPAVEGRVYREALRGFQTLWGPWLEQGQQHPAFSKSAQEVTGRV